MTPEADEAIATLLRVYDRAIPLRCVFEALNGSHAFEAQLHNNELGAAYIDPFISGIEQRGISAISAPLNRVGSSITQLRAKPTTGVPAQENHDRDPFGWLIALANKLHLAEAFQIPIDHANIGHVMSRETFAKIMQGALDKYTGSLHSVGDKAQAGVDEPRLRELAGSIVEGYAYGLNTQEYVDILAAELKKPPLNEPGNEAKFKLRGALVGVLETLSLAISKTPATGKSMTRFASILILALAGMALTPFPALAAEEKQPPQREETIPLGGNRFLIVSGMQGDVQYGYTVDMIEIANGQPRFVPLSMEDYDRNSGAVNLTEGVAFYAVSYHFGRVTKILDFTTKDPEAEAYFQHKYKLGGTSFRLQEVLTQGMMPCDNPPCTNAPPKIVYTAPGYRSQLGRSE